MATDRQDWSYARHAEHERSIAAEDAPSWSSCPDSVDAWRHERMLRCLLPLIAEHREAHWLTVGDGNYGSDAHFLKGQGAKALATSVSDATLAAAKERGYIDDFCIENAEAISVGADQYDFVLCKEAYHHFPRPPLAFYEMLRVARKAVVLIEPQELSGKPLRYLKTLVKKILRRNSNHEFERSGNFIFRVNVREIEKMMIALNYTFVAVSFLNDFYVPQLTKHRFGRLSWATLLMMAGVGAQNCLCKVGLLDYGLVCVVAFKQAPAPSLQRRLKNYGFEVRKLPINPYLEIRA